MGGVSILERALLPEGGRAAPARKAAGAAWWGRG